MSNPHDVTKAFEADLCAYTGAPFAVTTNSCTMAILLACAWQRHICGRPSMVFMPKLTYVGVPMSIAHAGHGVAFEDVDWQGRYALRPVPEWNGIVWDSARSFTQYMFNKPGSRRVDANFMCVSFHVSKILGHSQGGAILHNDLRADAWLRRARFDGRTEGVPPSEDSFDMLGYHCYLGPDVAAALRWKLASLPRENADLPRSDYPDLSKFPIFTNGVRAC